MRGLEDFEDCKFEYTEQYKEAILSVLDNELEVFDPLVDGDVGISEGMAYAREYVDDSILKADDYEVIKNLCSDMECHLCRLNDLTDIQRKGYEAGILLVGQVIKEIEEMKEQAHELEAEL